MENKIITKNFIKKLLIKYQDRKEKRYYVIREMNDELIGYLKKRKIIKYGKKSFRKNTFKELENAILQLYFTIIDLSFDLYENDYLIWGLPPEYPYIIYSLGNKVRPAMYQGQRKFNYEMTINWMISCLLNRKMDKRPLEIKEELRSKLNN